MIPFIENMKFSSQSWEILLPLVMMGLDIVTGLIYAWSSRTFKSGKMRSGLAKKAGELVIVIITWLFVYALSLPHALIVAVSIYISFMELMSIAENLDLLGVPLPAKIKTVLNNPRAEDIEELINLINAMEETEGNGNDKRRDN